MAHRLTHSHLSLLILLEGIRPSSEKSPRLPLRQLELGPDPLHLGGRKQAIDSGLQLDECRLRSGDILPYKSQSDDKIAREAAMAVGETSGQSTDEPKRVVSSSGRSVRWVTSRLIPMP